MNNIEDMQKSFEGQKFKVFSPFKCDISKNEDGNYVDDTTIFAFAWFCRGIASQAQQESKLHWCGTCEQNVERGCGDSACQYRYKLPPAPEGGDK